MMPFADYSKVVHSLLERVVITDKTGNILESNEGFGFIITNLKKVKTTHKKVMIIGNGGSAAIASHLQNDLCKAASIRGMVFTEPPLLTALSNDIGYIKAYRELIKLWAEEGDMLIAISSSGNSQNILNAVSTAYDQGCGTIITLSGFLSNNPLRSCGDVNLYTSSNEYGYVELVHSVLAHFISDQISKIH